MGERDKVQALALIPIKASTDSRLELVKRRFAIKTSSEFGLIICTQNSNSLTEIMLIIFGKVIMLVWVLREDDRYIFGQIPMKKKYWETEKVERAFRLESRPYACLPEGDWVESISDGRTSLRKFSPVRRGIFESKLPIRGLQYLA